jgi:hypothetical protein
MIGARLWEGHATCAEFLHHTKTLRDQSAGLEFTGPVCNLRDIDLGIAVGSAAKTAALHSIDCRCQTRVATAARKLSLIQADHAVALSLSMTHKAVGFDRPMPEADSTTSISHPPAPSQPAYLARPGTVAPETARHHGNQFTAPGDERDRHQGLAGRPQKNQPTGTTRVDAQLKVALAAWVPPGPTSRVPVSLLSGMGSRLTQTPPSGPTRNAPAGICWPPEVRR